MPFKEPRLDVPGFFSGDGVGNACFVWLFPWDAACLGFFAAPGVSVQQVEICAVPVT